jgi:hypothetical protein
MEKLAQFYAGLIWSIEKVADDLRTQLQMVQILKEREEEPIGGGHHPKWLQRDTNGAELRYRQIKLNY